MDLSEFFQENKKIIFIFVFVYIIVMVGIIIYIWSPKSIKRELKDITMYEIANEETVQSKVMTDYIDAIAFNLMLGEKDLLSEKISEGYIKYKGINKDTLIKQLEKEGYFSYSTQIKDITQYKLEDIYVYRGTLTNGTSSRKINIIETYPYEYTISFDDIYKYSENIVTKKSEGIKFEILQAMNNINYVEYKVRITNVENNMIKMNLNSEDAILIELNDGTGGNVSYPKTSGEDIVTLSKNSSITKTLMFRIPLQEQESISKIIFKDVDFLDTEQNVEVNM